MNADMVALFRQLSLGVYVIGVASGSARDAFTAASVMQVSYDPLLLAVAIDPDHASYALLCAGGTFAVSVLGVDQRELARRFGTPAADGVDKMQGVRWRTGRGGAPILAQALCFYDCVVQMDQPAGDHHVVIGQVVDGALLAPGTTPLLYANARDLDGSAALYPARFESRSA